MHYSLESVREIFRSCEKMIFSWGGIFCSHFCNCDIIGKLVEEYGAGVAIKHQMDKVTV